MNTKQQEELARKLSAIEAPPPPEGLLEKLHGDIPEEFPVENRSHIRQFTGWSMGLAASILVTIGAAYFALRYEKEPSFRTATSAVESARAPMEEPQGTNIPRQSIAEKKQSSPLASEAASTAALRKDNRVQSQPAGAPAAEKEMQALAPPPAPAKPKAVFAPEAQAEIAEASRDAASVESGVAGGAVGGVAANEAAPAQADARTVAREKLDAARAVAPAAAPAAVAVQSKGEATADKVRPIRVTGDVVAPVVIRRVEPAYPEDARRAGTRGTVILELQIGKRGDVVRAVVLKALSPSLDDAAVQAARQWKFRPATLNGNPVDVLFDVAISFAPK